MTAPSTPSEPTVPSRPSRPFQDLDEFLALPRVSGLAVSPDGTRVVTSISELNEKRTEFVSALWELDPAARQPARRLTRGAKGETSPAFTAAGDLMFLAARPTDDDEDPPASLWRLPAAGGEAIEELALPGGVSGVRTARATEVTVVAAKLLRSADDIDDDKRLRKLRKDNKVSAVLHSAYPVRHWDHDVGPDHPHLIDAAGPRDLTPHPGDALREANFDVSADGTFVVTSWHDPAPGASVHSTLVRVDLATGDRSVISNNALPTGGQQFDTPIDVQYDACENAFYVLQTGFTPAAPDGRVLKVDGVTRVRTLFASYLGAENYALLLRPIVVVP